MTRRIELARLVVANAGNRLHRRARGRRARWHTVCGVLVQRPAVDTDADRPLCRRCHRQPTTLTHR